MENETIFQKYAELVGQIKILEQSQKELGRECLEELEKEKADQMKTSYGTFSRVIRKKWSYSEKVKELEVSISEKVKELETPLNELKKNEEETGKATREESSSLMFRQK